MSRNNLNEVGLLILRIFLFAIIIFYGSQKMLGLFGGEGISGTLEAFKRQGFPEWLTMLAIISEFGGGIAVLIGLLTRLAALGIAVTMAVAAYANFSPKMSYPAAHLPLALCGIALALVFTGAGQFSLDYALTKGRRRGKFVKSS